MRVVWCGSLYCLSFSTFSFPPRRYSTSATPVSAISQISCGCRDVALRVGALRSNLRREYSMSTREFYSSLCIHNSVQPRWSTRQSLEFPRSSFISHFLASRGVRPGSIFHSSRRDTAVARTSSNCCCCSDGRLLRGNERPLCAPQTEPKHVLLLMP